MKNSTLVTCLCFTVMMAGCSNWQAVQNTEEQNSNSSVAFSSKDNDETDMSVWKNEELGYGFSYPMDIAVTTGESTSMPGKKCAFADAKGTDAAWMRITFGPCRASTDAPLGLQTTEKIRVGSLNQDIEANCFTYYGNGETYSETPSDAVYHKDCSFIVYHGDQRIDGSYVIGTEYGKSIPTKEVESMSESARQVISSFKTLQ